MSAVAGPDDIRHELAMLATRVEAVERRLARNASEATLTLDLAALMDDVRQISQELFPGPCEFTSEFDPEYPDDRYIVVTVEATGELQEIAERGCLWDERIRRLSKHLFGNLRLLIVPR